MTQVAFSAVGNMIAGPIGGSIGSMIGSAVDSQIVASLQPAKQVGPRLEGLRVQGSGEGQALACVFGRARVAGHVIWAARFMENKRKQSSGKGGKSYDYAYSLSFALGVGEGPIDGIGRIWADGMPMDMSGVTYRVHRGDEGQVPDPLIEAIEGEAPAYRGTAYVVFEDLPLGEYANRVPQLSFEVFRRARGSQPRLEEQLQGVCLIPGAGEFVLATDVVKRRLGITRFAAENHGAGQGRADLEVSLDQLQMQLPNVRRVNLVVGWFGTDLRAGECKIKPGVETRAKVTAPLSWSVGGVDRWGAHQVSNTPQGAVAYGGTPSDDSVRQAIRSLKARGFEVVLYPFVFMDCDGYPWRGRISANGAVDVARLFGDEGGWGLTRQVLHYARMVADEGAHGLVIGSEMRGLTLSRDAQGGFPAVALYRELAAQCRAIVGSQVQLTYAADWSEYAGLRDGGEVRFHLDPLWADPNIDYVGIDWYPPMGDWRADEGGRDAEAFNGPRDPDYLAEQVAGGRDYDWYYATPEDEALQVRTPIYDGDYQEHWIWRVKDLKGWWSHAHHERVGGVRQAQATAWMPQMKPVRFMEFGCAAVDRGGNAPNLFMDPKSDESALPPWSDGTRDDAMQRALLEGVLGHYSLPQNNPVSQVYGGPMLAGADAWCWDARPWPAFPARQDLWADASAWRAGHWLNGRTQGTASDVVEALLKRAGVRSGYRVEGIEQAVSGVVLERPITTRAALTALLAAIGATACERQGQVVVSGTDVPVLHLKEEALAIQDDTVAVVRERTLKEGPQAVRVRFIQEGADYQTGAVVVRSDDVVERPEGAAALNHVVDFDLPCVVGEAVARHAGRLLLAGQGAEQRVLKLGPLEALQLEAGDVLTLEAQAGAWRVTSIAYEEVVSAKVVKMVAVGREDQIEDWRPGEGVGVLGAPWVQFLDLPPLPGQEDDARPLMAVAVDPWRPMAVHGGASEESLIVRGVAQDCAVVGELRGALSAGPVDRWDEVNTLCVQLEGGQPLSMSAAAVLDGSNLLAVKSRNGWELIRYRDARLVEADTWCLTGLLRGQQGTQDATMAGAPDGAAVVVVDAALVRVDVDEGERGLERLWRVGPLGLPPGGDAFSEARATWRGQQAMPWSPVHLRGQWSEGGLSLNWTARSRLGADGWDYEADHSDARRYRLRVMDGDLQIREWEVDQERAFYTRSDFEADITTEPALGARVLIAQWGAKWGWGQEAVYALP